MNAYLQQLRQQLAGLWGSLTARQKGMYVAVGVLFVAGLAGIITWSARPQYEALYTDIDLAEAAKVKAELDAAGTDYRLENGGRTILVPVQQRDTLRLEMSTRGAAPAGGLIGFEILDGINPMQTTEDKTRNFHRALGGEIARMIKKLDGVTDAGVIITVPEERLFEAEAQPVTAAVTLTLARDISQEQVKQIRKLVAGSVPGLKLGDVQITDTLMRDYPYEDEDGTGTGGNLVGARQKQLQLERSIVKNYENDLKSALAQVLGGADKVTVRVNVAMDFDRVERDITNRTKPGFEQLLESQQTNTEQFEGVGLRPGGAAGVESNIPNYEGAANSPMRYERSEARTNYLHNEEHTTRIQSPYIKRLTAAVNVDGTYTEERDAAGNLVERAYVARSAEQMAQIEQIVKTTLGYDATRGDAVSVTNVAFDRARQHAEEESRRQREAEQKRYVMMGFAGMVIAILLILLLLEAKTYLTLREQKALRERELALRQAGTAIVEKGMVTELTIEEKEKLELRRRAEKAAHDQPEMVANLIRTWLAEEER